jgi:hypothetical protein
MPTGLPLTGDELIALGRAVNRITKRLKWTQAEWVTGVPSQDEQTVHDLTVEVQLPEAWGREGETLGEIRFHEGWLGFYPYQIEE